MTQSPIEDYALLSNRATMALVAHGRVDWWCVPRVDSDAVFAALLGTAAHGFWAIVPEGASETARTYRQGSFILETDWHAPGGRARSTDFLTAPDGPSRRPGVSLVRVITCTTGALDIDAHLALVAHGHCHVARHWRDWLLRAIAGDPQDLQIMYGVAGERQLPERVLDHLPGYRGATPVRVGNAAHTQYQADVIGEVMLALAGLRDSGVAEDQF